MCNAEPRNALGEYFAVPCYIILLYSQRTSWCGNIIWTKTEGDMMGNWRKER